MINLILPVVDEPEKFAAFAKKVAGRDVKVFVGIRRGLKFDLDENINENLSGHAPGKEETKTSNLSTQESVQIQAQDKLQETKTRKNAKTSAKKKSKKFNVEVHTFAENANVEEIINSLHSAKMEKGKILICRRPLTDEEFLKLANSQKDIASLKAKHSKFFTALKNFAKKIVKRFFAFTYFEDISAICFGENMFELMSTIQNLSMASRINRYVGIDVEEVETNEKQVKKQYSRAKNILIFLLWTLLFVGSVVGGVLVCVFTPLHALTIILVIFWIALALFLWFVGFINFTRTLAVGNLRFGRAEELCSFSNLNQTKSRYGVVCRAKSMHNTPNIEKNF